MRLPEGTAAWLEPHLPPPTEREVVPNGRPFVTLTFATSLDSALSLGPGLQTKLSGPESKAMTHYLRRRHDAICVGIGTVVADDPRLCCRLDGVGLGEQPRPIIIDPRGRWTAEEDCNLLRVVKDRRGLAPFVITALADPPADVRARLEKEGGKFIVLENRGGQEGIIRFNWVDILSALHAEGLQSVMVEGGAVIINSLLSAGPDLVDSVIVTIAPTWLGQGIVVVSPSRASAPGGQPMAAARLVDVSWHTFGEDAVLCGKMSDPPH